MNARRASLSPRRALLLAGLFLFRSLPAAEAAPPARSVAPAPTAVVAIPTPEVRAADLKALREQAEARLDEQARQVSRTAALLDQLQGDIRQMGVTVKNQDSTLGSTGNIVQSLDRTLVELGRDLAAESSERKLQGAQVRDLSLGLKGLRDEMDLSARQMREGLADITALREDLKSRQSRLDSLTDLLAVMKRDLESNSEEIVEVKQALKALQAPKAPEAASGEWWDQLAGWKYLPAVAVTLSVVAVGMAASR
jgi:hypothetical protein